MRSIELKSELFECFRCCVVIVLLLLIYCEFEDDIPESFAIYPFTELCAR